MSRQTFLPANKSEKEIWLKNFANKINQYAVKYNISTAEVSDIQASLLHFGYYANYHSQYTEYSKKLLAYVNEIMNGVPVGASASIAPTLPIFAAPPPATAPAIFLRIKSIVNRIKSHLSYTIADGLDLGVEMPIAKKAKPNLNTIKPSIYVHLIEGGQPEIVWTRNGMDALEIWVHRDNEEDFVKLDVDSKPNYTDTTELPIKAALWKYKAIYRMDDKIVGHWSDVVSITVVKQLL